MGFVTAISRFILPTITLIILVKCILTLWLGHPKEKTYGYIIDMLDGQRYALNMWETSIGRGASCDITVSYDTVARVQAVFTRRIDGWYIYDIAPKSGIKINGKKIEKKATVVDGDIIALGSMRFRFEVTDDPVQRVGKKKKKSRNSSAPTARPDEMKKTVYDIDKNPHGINSVPSFGDSFYTDSLSFTLETPNRTDNQPRKKEGPSQPKIVNRDTSEAFILCGNEVTIGSGRRCDIKLRSSSVARSHAILILYEDGWAIDDVAGDKKDTFLNGKKVTAPQLLFDGDIIAVGDERLFYEC